MATETRRRERKHFVYLFIWEGAKEKCMKNLKEQEKEKEKITKN